MIVASTLRVQRTSRDRWLGDERKRPRCVCGVWWVDRARGARGMCTPRVRAGVRTSLVSMRGSFVVVVVVVVAIADRVNPEREV